MARTVNRVAKALGARIVARISETGGGAFGAARLPAVVASLRARLKPGKGRGRPTADNWVRHPKVPMSAKTERRLKDLAKKASRDGRKVSPMQLAAHLLEDAVEACSME